MDSVKIISAALDELPDGDIVLRGVIDCGSIDFLQVADYQREVVSPVKIGKLVTALRESSVPDIELSMRGEQFTDDGKGAFSLLNPVFIVDGLQRITAAKKLRSASPDAQFHIGVLVHFGKTEEWERKRFEVLNLTRVKLSPNVTLRNLHHDNPTIAALYNMCIGGGSKDFVLKGRVCWQQYVGRGELITATTFVKVVGMLHSHIGSARTSDVMELSRNVHKIAENVGKIKFLANVREFFRIIDAAWGIERVVYRQSAVYLKATFMLALAKMFSDHEVFWRDDRLVVDAATIKKLQNFPTADPTVVNTSASTGKALDSMEFMLIEHVNAGRRTHRLVRRSYLGDDSEE